jgi:hypothetical protein
MKLKKSRSRSPQQQQQQQQQAPAPPAAPPAASRQEYARLGSDAPIAWPSVGGRRVPVTGELSPHAMAALKRMGITQE